jgi:MOSC domain-containing protein
MSAAITGLFSYPVKSCRGIAHERAQLAATGFEGDRHWMLVRPNGRFVTQRELPRMALVGTQLNAAYLVLAAPGMPDLEVSREAAGVARDVTVWKFDGRGIDCGDQAAAWATQFLETPLRLVRFDPSAPRVCSPEWTLDTRAVTEFSDGYPILVISRASLADLNARLPQALPMERFRPNVVIDGVEAYDEDRIHELRAGPVTLRIVKPCARCSITTTDQDRGAVDGVEPLRTLKEYRYDSRLKGVLFGQNAIIVDGVGEHLQVGQRFDVRWKQKSAPNYL